MSTIKEELEEKNNNKIFYYKTWKSWQDGNVKAIVKKRDDNYLEMLE